MNISKATSDAVSALLDLAFNHEEMEGDTSQQRRLTRFAADNGLTHLLPEKAHGMMHDMGIEHKHEGMAASAEHDHPIVKAFNPITKEFTIVKSWQEGPDTHIEGYISPDTPDKQKEAFAPEAFTGSLQSFFDRCAPVSSNHGMMHYPVGHMQKAALVRNGRIFQEFYHPTDPAEFTQFDGTGTGWYGRIVINDPQASAAIQKGNLGGFSWTGNANKWKQLPQGGRLYTNVNHVMEATVAAYPINQDATIAIAKAYGLEEHMPDTTQTLEQLLAQILTNQTPAAPEAPVQKGITLDELTAALGTFKTDILATLDTKVADVQKAFEDASIPDRGQPATSQGVQHNAADIETDTVGYLVRKAATVDGLNDEEQRIAWGITQGLMTRSMGASSGGDDSISFYSL